MTRKAKGVPSPRAAEATYRAGLLRYVVAAWRRISGNPEANVDEIIEMLAIPAIAKMLADVETYNQKRVVEALAKVGALNQQNAAIIDVKPTLSIRRAANVELITKLTDQQREMVARELSTQSEVPLQLRLQQRLSVSRSRAKLIARDQVSKTNADLNETRFKAAGSQRYEWSTSGDERVRDRHVEVDGEVYTWEELTGAEDGLPPGQPIQCRCVAIAIFD